MIEDVKNVGTEIEHPLLGKMILERLSLPNEVSMGGAAHHGWVDGSGPPLGLWGLTFPGLPKLYASSNLSSNY